MLKCMAVDLLALIAAALHREISLVQGHELAAEPVPLVQLLL